MLKSLFDIFATFFKIGLFTFGGGYAMLPMIEADVVDKKHWMEKKEFVDMLAIVQSVPGAIAINTSIYVGYKHGGFIGALAGSSVTIGLTGLDFVLTSLFAMLTAEQWRNRKTALSLWVALFGYAAARVLMPENALAVSIALCAAAGLVWGASRRKRDSGNCVLNKEA